MREPANRRTPIASVRATKFASALLPENRDINTARAFRPNAPAIEISRRALCSRGRAAVS